MFWNHTWYSVQWRALCTQILEVNLSALIYRLFHEDFSSILRTNCIVLMIEEKKSSWNSLLINADKLSSEMCVYIYECKVPMWLHADEFSFYHLNQIRYIPALIIWYTTSKLTKCTAKVCSNVNCHIRYVLMISWTERGKWPVQSVIYVSQDSL